jgi:hypothetical protein
MSHFSNQNDFHINQKLEEQRFLIAEKKMQMIQLQAKIDALGVFNGKVKFSQVINKHFFNKKIIFIFIILKVNLKELEEYNNAAKFAEHKRQFDSDLYQNLELWDTLMKVLFC